MLRIVEGGLWIFLVNSTLLWSTVFLGGQSLEQKCLITWEKTPRIGSQPFWGCVALDSPLNRPVVLFPICEMSRIIVSTSPGTWED